MTPKELKHLSRRDLLEMLLELSQENENLREENRQLQDKLNDRYIAIEDAGSLAEASLRLSGVFQAAQEACERYAQNIRMRSEDLERRCQKAEALTREKCDAMLAEAKKEAAAIAQSARESLIHQESPVSGTPEHRKPPRKKNRKKRKSKK